MLNRTGFISSAVFIFCFFISSCASIFAPGSDQVTIKTSPDGADVYEGANFIGKTPLTHTFPRETFEERTLTVKKEGYATQELLLKKSLEKTALLNFIFITTSGATSWGIDALSGHMVKYSPDSYFIELERKKGAATQKEQGQWERVRFVILNQDSLKKNVAEGDGEYLRAFFLMRSEDRSSGTYSQFLDKVSSESLSLLLFEDPLEFYNQLEKI